MLSEDSKASTALKRWFYFPFHIHIFLGYVLRRNRIHPILQYRIKVPASHIRLPNTDQISDIGCSLLTLIFVISTVLEKSEAVLDN